MFAGCRLVSSVCRSVAGARAAQPYGRGAEVVVRAGAFQRFCADLAICREFQVPVVGRVSARWIEQRHPDIGAATDSRPFDAGRHARGGSSPKPCSPAAARARGRQVLYRRCLTVQCRPRGRERRMLGWRMLKGRVCLSVLLLVACGNAESRPRGMGGEASSCDPRDVCCAVADHACQGLIESQCRSRAYCEPVTGVPWTVGDDPFDTSGTREYVACLTLCNPKGGDPTPACILQEASPKSCFLINSEARVPDGWIGFLECEGLPDNSCQP